MNRAVALLQLGVNENQPIATWTELFEQKIFEWKQLAIKNASNHLLLQKKIRQLEKFFEAAHVLEIQILTAPSVRGEIEITPWANKNITTIIATYETAKAQILLRLSNAFNLQELKQTALQLAQLQSDFEITIYNKLEYFLTEYTDKYGVKALEDVKIGEVLYSQELLHQYAALSKVSLEEQRELLLPLARELYRIKKVLATVS